MKAIGNIATLRSFASLRRVPLMPFTQSLASHRSVTEAYCDYCFPYSGQKQIRNRHDSIRRQL